jgi:hypothetical protein
MKNRLLVFCFAMFAASLLANRSYGQLVAGSAPKPLACPNDPLNPIAGKPYDYSASFNPAGGTAFWYATKSTTFIDATGRVATIEAKGGDVVSDASATYAVDQAGATNPSLTNITWNSKGLSEVTESAPLFVVVDYKNATGSCANNMKVYNIIPKNGFTVDIKSMSSDGLTPVVNYGDKSEQCVADVLGAVFNTTSKKMDMNYGVQTLYFEVVAANFTGSFTPSFQISGLAAGQTAEIFWGATAATATNSIAATVNDTPVTAPAMTTALTNTSTGVSMYVKVVINNNNYEGLALQTIKLAVDAKNAQGQDDVLESDCSPNTAYADFAEQDIKPRPAITPNTSSGPTNFVLQN